MKVVMASGNAHKLSEIRAVLPTSMELISQSELGITSVEETGKTFVENAIIKARHACREANLPAISDDSGLEVDCLNGAPGIYSARYAGENATDADNNSKLLATMDGVTRRDARFRCVIVMMRHARDPFPLIASGTWQGRILTAPKGTSGFGYDPLFLVPDLGKSVAELDEEVKTQISHRGLALKELKKMLSTQ